MRIKVNINEPNEAQNMGTLQTWIEEHSDNQEDLFVACTPNRESLVFQFVYTTVLGCHRLFIYDPINDELIHFFGRVSYDFGRWIFERCDKYFGCDYEILM